MVLLAQPAAAVDEQVLYAIVIVELKYFFPSPRLVYMAPNVHRCAIVALVLF
jgi:hypothetical protein